MMMQNTVLVELLTEELPPKSLKALGEAFAHTLAHALVRSRHIEGTPLFKSFATPRRLAVRIEAVRAQSPDQAFKKKLLPVSVAFDTEGQPTPALRKKLAAEGLDESALSRLEREQDGKTEALFLTGTAPGQPLAAALQAALDETLSKLPIPKVMSYQLADGLTTVQFVRPAHRLIALHGAEVVSITALGLTAGRTTLGHRFLSEGEVHIADAESYEPSLEAAHVVADYAERRQRMVTQLQDAAADATVIMPDSLLDEVNALVEWPRVYAAGFDPGFLEVPQECLILTMQQNQRYFALTDVHGKMQNRFLLVSNLQTDDASAIVGGNERVLRARLSDARFFFTQDKKARLADRLAKLDQVVYLAKLGPAGSQGARVARITQLAGAIARLVQADTQRTERAAQLAKADLSTDMVGEFPELQGIMGRYYALADGEAPEVAQAIQEHYQPRFAGDTVPSTAEGVCVALADKMETLVCLFGLGQQPTGDKDPYALRRHAVGVLRILIEKNMALPLNTLIAEAFKVFPEGVLSGNQTEVETFLFDRLRGMLRDQSYSADEVEAVLSLRPMDIAQIPQRLAAVRAFARLPEAPSLAAANKRIGNILKKSEAEEAKPLDPRLCTEAAEQALLAEVERVRPRFEAAFAQSDYTQALLTLAPLKPSVDAFFDTVMVMAADPAVRANRIGLLRDLHTVMNQVADLSKLAA